MAPQPPQPPPPSQPPSAPPPSLFPASTVQHVAQTSLSIPPLKDNVASSLAADTEHRLRLILEDASKFMRHAKREKLTTEDIKRALETKGMEPVYGFLPNPSGPSSSSSAAAGSFSSALSTLRRPHFRRTMTSTGIVYHVEEEEIDLEQVAKRISSSSRSIPVRKGGAGWKAHWLAIEGVQPLIPENPTPQEIARLIEEEERGSGLASGAGGNTATDLATAAPTATSGAVAPAPGISSAGTNAATASSVSNAINAQSQPLVKHILSRELQVYYQRLTEAILHGVADTSASTSAAVATSQDEITDTTSLAALSSLRSDPGLHQLVPYLAQWVSSNITTALAISSGDDSVPATTPSAIVTRHNLLQRMIASIEALLLNQHVGIETYIHLLLPPLLSIILISLPSKQYDVVLRTKASGLLSYILRTFAPSYPSIKPRITRVLLEALFSGTSFSERRQQAQRTAADATSGRRGSSSASPQIDASGSTAVAAPDGPSEDPSSSSSSSSPPSTPLPTKLGALIALRICGGGMARAVVRARSQPAASTQGGTGDDDAAAAAQQHSLGSAFVALGQWLSDDGQQHADEVQAFVQQVKELLHSIAAEAGDDDENEMAASGGDAGEFWQSAISSDDVKAWKGWRIGLTQV